MGFIPPPPMSQEQELPEVYRCDSYLLRQKMLKLLGGRVDIYDPQGKPVLCCLQKAFKLKEDIRLYTDDTKRVELLTIQARQIIDFSAAYDVVDAQSGTMLGTLRRKGWQSLIRDAWEIMDPRGNVIARIKEDSLFIALLRRFLTNLIPQSYHFETMTGQVIARGHQNFNPFVHKIRLTMPQGENARLLDPRVVLGAAVLLVLIEGRQQ